MKNIVYINIDFYTYNKQIIDELSKHDYHVYFYNYKPCRTSWQKFRFKKSASFRRKMIARLVDKIVKETKDLVIDQYLVINPTTFEESQFDTIFKGHENAKKILYLWDAIETYPITKTYLKHFDKVYSFDPKDCDENNLGYRPTFVSDEILEKSESCEPVVYDIFYVASYSKERYQTMMAVQKYCDENGLKFKHHLFVKNKLAYLYFKLHDRSLKKKNVAFSLLNNTEKTALLRQSRAVLDTPLPTQKGLTMRVLEGMECHKKIITTNDYISHYDFYNTEDFFCLDPKAIHLDKARIQSPTTYTFDESSFTVASFVRELVLSQEVNA